MPAKATDPTRVTHATINLGAVTRNAERIRAMVPKAKIMAVIKANGYGHGLLRIAKSLSGVDALAVARTDEGLALRGGGITQRVIVLQGFANIAELQLHVSANLEPVVHSPWQIEVLEHAKLKHPIHIWLKVDTGMHRLGLMPDEFPSCLKRLESCPAINQPIPIMTHFANADHIEDDYTDRQMDFFNHLGTQGHERCAPNSAGILGWQESHTDWVRPGVMLYGVSPFADRTGLDEGLEPVMTLRTHLISIKHLAVGAKVGYGCVWTCERPTRLGVIAAGYADGYPRFADSGTPVLIRGHKVPIVGRVSMDMIMVDLTDCPEAEVGDEVTLWGEGLPIEEIAKHASTIPYTLLTGVTPRVRMIEI
jgi:alanine racemase